MNPLLASMRPDAFAAPTLTAAEWSPRPGPALTLLLGDRRLHAVMAIAFALVAGVLLGPDGGSAGMVISR